MKIADIEIGRAHSPFVIAEMSGNHNQSLERALAIVSAAAEAGAHALKLQTYTADTITLESGSSDFVISNDNSLWGGQSLHSLYQKAYTPWEWHQAIFDHAQALGLVCFSSPFDETAIDFLEDLNTPAYKIASFEIVHLPLIRKAAETGKPLIISTGMSSAAEIEEAVTTARDAGCRDLAILKCTSTYPAEPTNCNILTIPHMQQLFGCEVGLSDHTMGIGCAVGAVALGATIIEKHFTLDRADGGVDSTFSLEPAELSALVVETKRVWQSLGRVNYGATREEQESLIFRRSIYVSEDLKKGDVLSAKNLRIVRPGHGLAPKYWESVVGRRAACDVPRGTALDWDLIGG